MNYPKKSTEQKRLDGTDRADRDGKKNQTTSEIPEYKIPAWLEPKAKKWVKENIERFLAEGLLKDSDLTAFYLGANSLGEYLEFSSLMKVEKSKPVPNTNLIVKLSIQRNKAQKSFLDFARELGLTSRSRAVLGLEDDQAEGDAFDEF